MCIQPHPYQPLVATSGIDHDIKLWIPGALGDAIDESEMDKLLKNNMDKLDDIQRRAEGMDEAVVRYLYSLPLFTMGY